MTKKLGLWLLDFPEEAVIAGRILTGYGEIEYQLGICLGEAINDNNTALRALYRLRSEELRIAMSDAFLRPYCASAGLADDYAHAIGALRFARKVRNQYAHCHWYGENGRLSFLDIEDAARLADGELMFELSPIDAPLLARQEEFCCYAMDWLSYLQKEIPLRAGRLSSHNWKAPKVLEPPPLCNPSASGAPS